MQAVQPQCYLFQHTFDMFRTEHIKQCVIQGAKIRIDLALQITGQKTELFACLNSRSCENYSVNLLASESRDRHCNGKVGFTRTGRADTDCDGIFRNLRAVALLTDGFRLNRLPL